MICGVRTKDRHEALLTMARLVELQINFQVRHIEHGLVEILTAMRWQRELYTARDASVAEVKALREKPDG